MSTVVSAENAMPWLVCCFCWNKCWEQRPCSILRTHVEAHAGSLSFWQAQPALEQGLRIRRRAWSEGESLSLERGTKRLLGVQLSLEDISAKDWVVIPEATTARSQG